jgi:hypothetical protein
MSSIRAPVELLLSFIRKTGTCFPAPLVSYYVPHPCFVPTYNSNISGPLPRRHCLGYDSIHSRIWSISLTLVHRDCIHHRPCLREDSQRIFGYFVGLIFFSSVRLWSYCYRVDHREKAHLLYMSLYLLRLTPSFRTGIQRRPSIFMATKMGARKSSPVTWVVFSRRVPNNDISW